MARRRQYPRAPIELEVVYRDLDRFFADYTKDISKGGTFIRTFAPLKVGSRVAFSLRLPTLPAPMDFKGTVVRLADRGTSGMGIEFEWDSDAQRERFEQLVEKLMLEILGPRAGGEEPTPTPSSSKR